MKSENTIGAAVIPILIECIKSRGISASGIAKRTGIPLALVDDMDIRIPVNQHLKLWKYACEVMNDASLAINLREAYGNTRVHFVNNLATNSRNALEAINSWKRYINIVSKAIRIEILDKGEHVTIAYSVESPYESNPWMPEHAFCQLVKFGRDLIAEDFKPVEVTFRHKCGAKPKTYEAFFHAPVCFEKPLNSFVFTKTDLEKPFKESNPHLQTILKKQADEELGKLADEGDIIRQVKQVITRQLSTGDLDIESVARELNMSRTTLYRKLKTESISYNEILTNLRKEFSAEYMKNGMNISQTAFLLGYSTASAFVIAFKRWFGKSPGLYRHSFIG